jgi:hypothetical protein
MAATDTKTQHTSRAPWYAIHQLGRRLAKGANEAMQRKRNTSHVGIGKYMRHSISKRLFRRPTLRAAQ